MTNSSQPRIALGLSEFADRYDVVLCDIWGVVHNGQARYRAACDALQRFRAGGGTVILPAGSFTITRSIAVPYSNVSIVGAGSSKTLLNVPSSYRPSEDDEEGVFTFGNSIGGTLNDTFVGGIARGLHLYHLHHGHEPEVLRMGMPINIRDINAAATAGNAFVPARLEVPIAVEDPGELMRAVWAAIWVSRVSIRAGRSLAAGSRIAASRLPRRSASAMTSQRPTPCSSRACRRSA